MHCSHRKKIYIRYQSFDMCNIFCIVKGNQGVLKIYAPLREVIRSNRRKIFSTKIFVCHKYLTYMLCIKIKKSTITTIDPTIDPTSRVHLDPRYAIKYGRYTRDIK